VRSNGRRGLGTPETPGSNTRLSGRSTRRVCSSGLLLQSRSSCRPDRSCHHGDGYRAGLRYRRFHLSTQAGRKLSRVRTDQNLCFSNELTHLLTPLSIPVNCSRDAWF